MIDAVRLHIYFMFTPTTFSYTARSQESSYEKEEGCTIRKSRTDEEISYLNKTPINHPIMNVTWSPNFGIITFYKMIRIVRALSLVNSCEDESMETWL